MSRDITVMPVDYIVTHTKTNNIVSEDADGNIVFDVETEYVSLIRCKECRHSGESLVVGCVYCYEMDRAMDENGYCSEGEREGE